MKKPLEPRTMLLCFVLAATLLGWISVASYWSTHQLVRSFGGVSQAHQALETLQYIEVLMESAESSVRGFVITGDESRLTPYRYARVKIPGKLHEVAGLMAGHPEQRKALKKLSQLLSGHLSYLANTVTARTESYQAAAKQISDEDDFSNHEAMENMLSDIQQDERLQLRRRATTTSENSTNANAVLVVATAASLGIVAWVFGMLRRESVGRRHAESTTYQTESFLQSIIERIPHMILVKEARNLRLTLVNKAAEQWLGRSREDLLASNEFDLRPREEAREAIEEDHRILREGRPADLPEETFVLPGQAEKILHTQKIPIPDEQGNPAFLLTISEDITQRKQAETMLQLSRDAAVESERLKSEFIRNMSHEIRTPLSIIIGMTSLLKDTELSGKQLQYATTVQRAGEGLLNLSKSILDFSKIEAGAFTLETQDVHIRQIVESVVVMLGEQAKARGVSLVSLIYNDVPPVVLGDPVRFRQVLTQLVGNAVKFTSSGEIIVRLTEAKQNDSQLWLHCRISDTGIGILEEAQKHLFEPFRQGDGSRTRRFGGTGLGLAISKRVVELMGGDIGFESQEGHGSTFWFTIPFHKQQVQTSVVQVRSLPWARSRVLVVDENETYRKLLQEQLKIWSLASEVVSSGQTALDLLRSEHKASRPFPIVLLDMHMPDMDGVAFAKLVRADPDLSRTKLFVMTSDTTPLDDPTTASLGFSGWVSKPPKFEELHERLATAIESSDSQRHHAA